ncbi:polysaccharide biosynthesis C-terminal domain-containing protein [uncultured Eubacterium sp.]|uniref:polysaccharide biosynthesis C-terminal domain-containing protein n=1 Tax=uncultured Eubacterium sp. TaxID=165185 RepID=UPI002618DCEA|nr:polysaccharide biosynthesis C-terminal domain-containing protein [uncultured Eubacterium sp.]
MLNNKNGEVMREESNIKKNVLFATFTQILTIAFAFIVPKLLINYYGPQIHGLTNTISSLISYLTLAESGIGSASVQSLYSPLEKKDYKLVNADLNAIAIFYHKIGLVFSLLVFAVAFLYPLLASDGLDYWFVFALVLISGIANTVEYFFTSKYKVLLQADKKLYVINLINAVGIFLQGTLRIVFIYLKLSVFIIQLVPAIVYTTRLIIISIYVRRTYTYLDKSIKPNFSVGKKRWNVLVHQITNLVVNNTDNIVLSSFIGYASVSVYGVYNMIVSNISDFLSQALSKAVMANFGHLFSNGDKKTICDVYNKYERLYYYIIGVIFGICGFSICPFINLYMNKVNGINYVDNKLGLLFVIVAVLASVRIPSLTIITAVGHFKETQNYAIIEAVINIVASVILVKVCGIYGVLIGTIISFLYVDIMFIRYVNRFILKRKIMKTVKSTTVLIAVIGMVVSIGTVCNHFIGMNSWGLWFLTCLITAVVSLIILLIVVFAFDKSVFEYTLSMFFKKK